jgi:hypothetical protein
MSVKEDCLIISMLIRRRRPAARSGFALKAGSITSVRNYLHNLVLRQHMLPRSTLKAVKVKIDYCYSIPVRICLYFSISSTRSGAISTQQFAPASLLHCHEVTHTSVPGHRIFFLTVCSPRRHASCVMWHITHPLILRTIGPDPNSFSGWIGARLPIAKSDIPLHDFILSLCSTRNMQGPLRMRK